MSQHAALFASYHNHTTWSDGSASPADMIRAARGAGIREFGVSDHFCLSPYNSGSVCAVAPESLGDYVQDVERAGCAVPDMEIRLGLEVDYFEETFEASVALLQLYSFDYIIGSVHCVDGFQVDVDSGSWSALAPERRDRIWLLYWQRLRAAAETGFFDIIGHFDLPKKFACYPSSDLTAEALKTLDAIVRSGAAIEINTSGWDKPAREAYPSLFYLREAKRRGIPLVISADAHEKDSIDRYFSRARELARTAGYGETACFEHRKRSLRKI
ncbi:MAG: histidinol-phosphatase [Acidobacteria bacterium]|nr:histidinol-phosphatase [Acidobacteriota bacterium]